MATAVEAITFKVLIVGGFGIGKTSLIQQISDVPVVGTEVQTTGLEAAMKPTTTVGIEYGLFSVADGELTVTLLLFGTPGQDRFAEVRSLAGRGVDGLIVLVNGDAPETWAQGAELYESFNADGKIPTVVVVNRWPEFEPPPAGLTNAVELTGPGAVICGDVVNLEHARRFLVELLSLIFDQEFGELDEEVAADVPE